MFSTLNDAYCIMFGYGWQSQLVSVLSGFFVMVYFIMLALNDNSANVSGAIRVMFVIFLLTSITAIVSTLFDLTFACPGSVKVTQESFEMIRVAYLPAAGSRG